MKKILTFFAIVLLINSPVYALTREDIGTSIWKPNREGKWDIYDDVYTFEDLYDVFEDLSGEYMDLLDEYHSQETSYEEKISEKDKEIEQLEYELSFKTDDRNDDFIKIIAGFIIIVAIIITITKLKD